MEKNILKKTVIIFLQFLIFARMSAQTPSVIRHIRIPLWAELDAYPGSEEAMKNNDNQFDFPIARIKEVAPFLISGMVYGWTFTYTPSDESRGVEEIFEVQEIHPLELEKARINYDSPRVEESRFTAWCEYSRNDFEIQNYEFWNSVKNPVIQGIGFGKLENGFEGIKEASEDALKNAVREHYRKVIKNKPKEITGSVLIKEVPVIGVKSGQYIINLAFFLEYGRIKEYNLY